MAWWIWVVLGLVLLGAELLTPGGFYLLFFGCGALAVGLLGALGWSGPTWLQGALFSLLSVLSLLLFRRPLVRKVRQGAGSNAMDSLVGETAFARGEIPANGFGKAELRGTTWSVRNVGEEAVSPQQRCRVERVEGLTLWIRKE